MNKQLIYWYVVGTVLLMLLIWLCSIEQKKNEEGGKKMIDSEHAINIEVRNCYSSSWISPKTATASISTVAF
jgi:hypothetical protein